MRAAQIVQLHAHNGRMLTRPEILIEQFHEMRNAEQKKIVDEKMSEKMMMSRISSKLISMPSVDPSNLQSLTLFAALIATFLALTSTFVYNADR